MSLRYGPKTVCLVEEWTLDREHPRGGDIPGEGILEKVLYREVNLR